MLAFASIFWLFGQNTPQINIFQSRELQSLEDLVKTPGCLAQEPHIGDQQINAYGHPDLRYHRIGTCPQKAFDLQVLLDPLEKQFDLPTSFINGGYLLCAQMEEIR